MLSKMCKIYYWVNYIFRTKLSSTPVYIFDRNLISSFTLRGDFSMYMCNISESVRDFHISVTGQVRMPGQVHLARAKWTWHISIRPSAFKHEKADLAQGNSGSALGPIFRAKSIELGPARRAKCTWPGISLGQVHFLYFEINI